MIRARSIWILAFAFTCLAANPAQDLHGWKAQNVPGVVLDSVRESDGWITFSFKNVSSKGLMAYSVCFMPSGTSEFTSCSNFDNFYTGDILMAPGESKDVPITALDANQYANRTVRIAVAIYADGTSEGIPFNIRRVEMDLLGRALESYRVSNILSPVAEPTDEDTHRLAVKVGPEADEGPDFYSEYRVMKVPGLEIPDFRTIDRQLRYAFHSGAIGVRQYMLRTLDDIRALPVPSGEPNARRRSTYVSALKDHMREQTARLIDYYNRIEGGRSR